MQVSLKVERPGLLSTIQDMGRPGYQKDGVSVSGAMDSFALRIANILTGNEEGAPVVELTHPGPKISFTEDHLIALAGADISAKLNGKPAPLRRPFIAEKGNYLEFGRLVSGRFACLAIAGGPDIQEIMGSTSTFLQAGFGGFKGRALMKGDVIACKEPSKVSAGILRSLQSKRNKKAAWTPAAYAVPDYQDHPVVRVIAGPHIELFKEEAKEYFRNSRFVVSRSSGRMGYLLEGPELSLKEPVEILSTAVTFGTVQAAPGKTIILGADRQTTGGYPVIAQVISADLPIFIQLQPGKTIRFREVSVEEAHQALFLQESTIQKIKQAVYLKFS